MKKFLMSKENINPLLSSDDYRLRKPIPVKIDSILKSSNTISTKKNLAQVAIEYQMDKLKLNTHKPKTPLIKINDQKTNTNNLFTKNPRKSVQQTTKVNNQKLLIFSTKIQPGQKNLHDSCNQENALDKKLMELVNMITPVDKNKLNRCQSSLTLNLKTPTALIDKIGNKFKKQFALPFLISKTETQDHIQTPEIRVKTPSFLLKTELNLRYSQPVERATQRKQVKSSYFQSPRVYEQRMSYFQPVKKTQSTLSKLCINCEQYINLNLIKEHENECLGFKIILKMSSQELIDLLNKKINDKLNQLKEVQSKITSIPNSNIQVYLSQLTKIDRIINDLDAIRLKALKRFHAKNSQKDPHCP